LHDLASRHRRHSKVARLSLKLRRFKRAVHDASICLRSESLTAVVDGTARRAWLQDL
jgi:hypothetical protein